MVHWYVDAMNGTCIFLCDPFLMIGYCGMTSEQKPLPSYDRVLAVAVAYFPPFPLDHFLCLRRLSVSSPSDEFFFWTASVPSCSFSAGTPAAFSHPLPTRDTQSASPTQSPPGGPILRLRQGIWPLGSFLLLCSGSHGPGPGPGNGSGSAWYLIPEVGRYLDRESTM
jgi:hypothetical protein